MIEQIRKVILLLGPFHPQTLCIDNVNKYIKNKVSNIELYVFITQNLHKFLKY